MNERMILKKTSITNEYLKYSITNGINSKIVFFIISIIEIIDLISLIIDQITQIFYLNRIYIAKEKNLNKLFQIISPYQYFFDLISEKNSNLIKNGNFYAVCVYVLFYILFILLISLLPKENFFYISTIEKSLFFSVVIFFYDYIFFRLLSLFCFDFLIKEIMTITNNSTYGFSDVILLFIFSLLIVFFYGSYIIYFLTVNIWTNFRTINSDYLLGYPFDHFFSPKYDIILLTIKILVSFNKNYEFFHIKDEKIDYVVLFIIALIVVIFYSYFIYLIYIIFFSFKCLYILINFYSLIRLFFIILLGEIIILRIILPKNNDYKIFLFFLIIFCIIDIFLIIQFRNFSLNKAVNCQNLIAVGWYFQANDIEMKTFIIKWIINHKRKCNEINCLICKELLSDEIENKYCIKPQKTEITGSLNFNNNQMTQLNKKKKEISNENVNKLKKNDNNNKEQEMKNENECCNFDINIITKIFPSFKFMMLLIKIVNNSKNLKSKDDLIRLDFIYLSSLFLSNQNVDFLFFSKICLLIYKYEQNKNIVGSLRLIFNITKKTFHELTKDYSLLKKNEDLRCSLLEYIKDYENFIQFGTKSPQNYLSISNKFHKFKKIVKKIHSIFKKNTEQNYQLLLLRYCYETLLHLNFRNVQLLELNNYSDYLDHHFNSDKLLLIKYVIDSDLFYIIKCSKEFLRQQGDNLEVIFPDYLDKIGVKKLIDQLSNLDKNGKTIFEFVIKDILKDSNIGYIQAIKIKYFIYPTNNINEIFIQGNYISGYVDYLVYVVNKDNKDDIFSFSSQIYKYLGLTPLMISLLRKIGRNVSSRKILKRKFSDNDFIYTLSYAEYFPYYSRLIKNDILLDLPNFLQIKEKQNEIELLSKKNKIINFYIKPKGVYESKSMTYKLFTIKEIKKFKNKENNTYKPNNKNDSSLKSEDDDFDNAIVKEEEEENSSFDEQFSAQGLGINASVASSLSMSRQSSFINLGNKNKQNEKNDEQIKGQNDINNYTLIIIIFGLFLMILSATFLIIEFKENTNFKSLFNLFETFKYFKRGIESTPLSLLSNYKFYTKNGNFVNMYENYSLYLQNNYTNLKNLPKVNELIKTEIKQKYPSIILYFDSYHQSLFKINNKGTKRIQELVSYSYTLKQNNNYITLYKSVNNFISVCREYNNYVSSLLLNDLYMQGNFSLYTFSYTDDMLVYNMYPQYKKQLNDVEKNMLLVLVSYPSLHIGLSESSYFLQQEFHNSLNILQKYLISFCVLSNSLHLFLVIICLLFLRAYVNMIKMYIMSSDKLFCDKKYMELQIKRIDQIKIMSNLYSENPLKIAERIDMIEEKYKKKYKQENVPKKNKLQNSVLMEENTSNNNEDNEDVSVVSETKKKNFKETITKIEINKNEINEDDKNKNEEIEDNDNTNLLTKHTLSPSLFSGIGSIYKNVLLSFFSIYYTYSIVFFIFVIFAWKNLSYLVTYCDINTQIDEYVYDNFNAVMYMYITNSTPYFYNLIINGNNFSDYLEVAMSDLYNAIEEKENIENNHPKLFPPINKYANINCSDETFVEDEEFKKALNELEVDYGKFIKGLCDVFPVAKANKDDNILYEIAYKIKRIYKIFQTGSYDDIFEIYFNFNLFECYTLILTFNKIIRTYFNEKIFREQVDNFFKYFTELIITYMILSVFFEVILFLVLNFSILKKIKYSNKLLIDFLDSLKF